MMSEIKEGADRLREMADDYYKFLSNDDREILKWAADELESMDFINGLQLSRIIQLRDSLESQK
jgi:hypothetical protein